MKRRERERAVRPSAQDVVDHIRSVGLEHGFPLEVDGHAFAVRLHVADVLSDGRDVAELEALASATDGAAAAVQTAALVTVLPGELGAESLPEGEGKPVASVELFAKSGD